MALVLNSYARCARIRLTISATTSTLEPSRKPCRMRPAPCWPGVVWIGWPDDCVAEYRLRPSLLSPAGFWKRVSCNWPTCVGAVEPGTITDTVPSVPMDTDRAFCGMLICGDSRKPSEVRSEEHTS